MRMRTETKGNGINIRTNQCSQPRPRTTTPAVMAREIGSMGRLQSVPSTTANKLCRIALDKLGDEPERTSSFACPDDRSPVTGKEFFLNSTTAITSQASCTTRDK